jgi:hypothetical protein
MDRSRSAAMPPTSVSSLFVAACDIALPVV